ncbi:aminoglycoside phosphotransferase family protein [Rhizorhabdus argentea]|uniref:aminoglycoside phosphotransferase family protein n=1 Tax=Rhizorhabdus argentea TaxID=1387174 RepID=UPI0030ED2257
MLFPTNVVDFSAEFMTDLARKRYPGTRVDRLEIVDVKDSDSFESSSSALVTMNVTYADGNPLDLPENLLVKTSLNDTSLWYANTHAFFSNELNFYDRLRPELDLEAPRSLGGAMQADGRYVIALEDMRKRGAKFCTVLTEDVTVDHARNLLDTLARLHARYWESPRFSTDLSWLETHVGGELEDMMRKLVVEGVSKELSTSKYKREILGMMNLTEQKIRQYSYAVKNHQSTLPQTIVHGDSHLGNMYFLPDGKAGLIDWQFMVKGYVAHDLGYFLTVALPVEVRRREERELLDFYREKLLEYGATNGPDRETLWLEYRRAMVWGIYPAWLSVPATNYGLEHAFVVHLRLFSAFQDHETRKLVEALG